MQLYSRISARRSSWRVDTWLRNLENDKLDTKSVGPTKCFGWQHPQSFSPNNTEVPCTKLRVKDLYLELLHHYYIFTKFLRPFEALVRDWALLFVKQSTSITHILLKQAILPALSSLLPNFATPGGLNVCTCV